MNLGEPPTIDVTCPQCGAVSRPPITVDIHEEHCPDAIGNRERHVEVDGQPARLRSVPNPPLIHLTVDELCGVVDELRGKVAIRASERGRASKALKDAQSALDKAVAELLARWRADHGMDPLPLNGDEDESDD